MVDTVPCIDFSGNKVSLLTIDSVACDIAKRLESDTENSLFDLNLSTNRIDDICVEKLIEFVFTSSVGKNRFRRIILSDNNVTCIGLRALVKVLLVQKSVQYLVMPINMFLVEDVFDLRDILKSFALENYINEYSGSKSCFAFCEDFVEHCLGKIIWEDRNGCTQMNSRRLPAYIMEAHASFHQNAVPCHAAHDICS